MLTVANSNNSTSAYQQTNRYLKNVHYYCCHSTERSYPKDHNKCHSQSFSLLQSEQMLTHEVNNELTALLIDGRYNLQSE